MQTIKVTAFGNSYIGVRYTNVPSDMTEYFAIEPTLMQSLVPGMLW